MLWSETFKYLLGHGKSLYPRLLQNVWLFKCSDVSSSFSLSSSGGLAAQSCRRWARDWVSVLQAPSEPPAPHQTAAACLVQAFPPARGPSAANRAVTHLTQCSTLSAPHATRRSVPHTPACTTHYTAKKNTRMLLKYNYNSDFAVPVSVTLWTC